MKPDMTLAELLGWDGTVRLRADLHCHSTLSDGSFTSEELIDQAQEATLTHLAITNHDTTQGINDAKQYAQDSSVTFVGGIEISAWDPKRERKVHVLGFGLEEDSPAIAALCDPLLARRSANTAWQKSRLQEAGYIFNEELLNRLETCSTGLYKQHLMAALTAAPFTSDEYQTLYKSLFKGSGICNRDITYVDMRDAVRAICEDCGVAVLAHPGQLKSYEAVPELVDAGLWGIECFHPDHLVDDHKLCEELALRFGLECTGGSDFHGAFGNVERLGQCMLERMLS